MTASVPRYSVLLALALALLVWPARAADVVHVELEPGATAAIMGGRTIALEVVLPGGDANKAFLTRFLDDDDAWTAYKNLKRAGIPYLKLSPQTQRRVIEALFSDDYCDNQGWWHTVTYYGATGVETLFGVSEWLTGRGTNYREVLSVAENHEISEHLKLGDTILIPKALLLEAMKTPSPKRKQKDAVQKDREPVRAAPTAGDKDAPQPSSTTKDGPAPDLAPDMKDGTRAKDRVELESVDLVDGTEDLRYGEDKYGKYAEYRIKPGETVYSDVVVRFTDLRENSDIQEACNDIFARSGLKQNAVLQEGQRLRIPMELLSAPYQPQGSDQRESYEAVHEQAKKLKVEPADKEAQKGLKGVLIVLDPGHGGRDKGAMHVKSGLYEDELTYDIVSRLKKLLETRTQAKVAVTLKDPNQGYEPSAAKSFIPDDDEYLLTTPPYPNEDAHVSASLRWYLANDIFRQAQKAGVKDSRAIFLSIHCDSVFNAKMRGTMIYVPGAAYRKDEETPDGESYDRYAEARAQRTVKTRASQRQKDEALSFNFATSVIATLNATKKPNIKVHGPGEPIRNVIRQKGGKMYVPAVLRNCTIPTKVLIETANLMNAEDRACLADPVWRQAYAEALLKAITTHFGG